MTEPGMEAFEVAAQVTTQSQGDWHRNIVTLRESVHLLARFVDDAEELRVVMEHEAATKPAMAPAPIINRPFEDAEIYSPIGAAIHWPFEHPCASRFSNGSFGVWYGAGALETSIYETAHHFKVNTLASAAALAVTGPIYQERRVHLVHCSAMLIDLRERCAEERRLIDPMDYSYCQSLGLQLHAASQPGVISRSARHETGTVIGVFAREALSNPRNLCYLTYSLDTATGRVGVERTPGKVEWVV